MNGPRSSLSLVRTPPVLGRYRLLKKIGMGGMAEIWVAAVSGISGVRKICVVKQILPHLAESPEFVRMFLDEARIAATLDHPNLVQMYDVEEVDGIPLIAMEYLHGEDLRTIKKSLTTADLKMPLEHALSIAVGVAAGLHYAHEKVGFDGKPLNIVHRDVSPHNVFVTYDGAVKILDFGIAKARNRVNETRDGALKGKVPYMSPEQCKSEALDRRSDIYSVGILLYEMSTGNKLFRRGATEFELMRAIVEDSVKPPSEIASDYPPALERIVLRCLARDRDARYPTARDLQADLEAFARENRLATSPLGLSSFLSDLFGHRVEAWRGALASGDDLVSQLVELHGPGGGDSDDTTPRPRAGAAPPPSGPAREVIATKRSAPLITSPDVGELEAVFADDAGGAEEPPGESVVLRDLVITKRRIGSVLLVSLSGRMTETFQGAAFGRDLSGRLLFDLSGVQRVTSFGVREWLALLTALSPRASGLFFARCSEPIVNQVSMIRRFAGDGRIVSFHGPYRCDSCGNTFGRLFDCERDAHAIRTADPPLCPCPRCGAPGTFDDDAQSYFAFAASHAGAAVPADVRVALDELARLDAGGAAEAIEKTVDERGTWIRVRCKLDESVRWKRVLDGIEGDLVFDLSHSAGVSPEGVERFDFAVRALGDEVKTIRIEGCPRVLLEHLADAKRPLRATVTTAVVDGLCERCAAPRQTLLGLKDGIAAALEDREPYMPCKRCNSPLSFPSLKPLLRRLAGAPASPQEVGPTDAAPAPPASPAARSEAPAPAPGVAASPAPTARRRAALLAVLVLGAGAVIFAVASRGPRDVEPPAAPEQRAAEVEVEGPPSWASTPFAVEGDQLFAVGRGVGGTQQSALALARSDAIARVVDQMLPALSGSEVHGFIRAQHVRVAAAAGPDASEVEAARYLRQVGAFATPERADAAFHEAEGRVTAIARYRMRKQDFDAAVQGYRKTVSLFGLTAALLFPALGPDLRASGDLVIIAVDESGPAAAAGVRAGDVVASVNGRAVATLDALRRSLLAPTESGAVGLALESGGERRTATFEGTKARK